MPEWVDEVIQRDPRLGQPQSSRPVRQYPAGAAGPNGPQPQDQSKEIQQRPEFIKQQQLHNGELMSKMNELQTQHDSTKVFCEQQQYLYEQHFHHQNYYIEELITNQCGNPNLVPKEYSPLVFSSPEQKQATAAHKKWLE